MEKRVIDLTVIELQGLITDSFKNNITTLPNATADSEFINVEQASKLLNLAPQTIYTLRFEGKLQAYKTGKKLHFRKSELLKLIEDGKIGNKK
jgi:excisionase family DNA binding protein